MKPMAIKCGTKQSDDPRVAWRKAVARLARMSQTEKAQTLVAAGILDRNLRLKTAYKCLLAGAE